MSIDGCVLSSEASSDVFVRAFSAVKSCTGDRVIRTLDELESLRFCDIIEGSLSIEVDDIDADFEALNELTIVRGLCPLWLC